MTVDQFTNLLVTITLVEMMLTIGLGVRFADLVHVAKDWWLMIRAALANYLLVPAATVGLLVLFDPHPMVAAGFLVLAVCPGAPYGPPLTALAKGDVTVAVALMVLLAGSSAVVAPLLLSFLPSLLSGDDSLEIDALQIAGTLLLTQLLPLAGGVAFRWWRPVFAQKLLPLCTLASKVLNLLTVGVILATQFQLLAEVRPRGFAGMLLLLIACWAAGWLLGGRDAAVRKAMTLTASLRNVGVALVIAATAFAGTPAVTAILVYGLLEVLGSLLLALVWRRAAAPASV
jgi:BASS family bile acid:Na+ symporter